MKEKATETAGDIAGGVGQPRERLRSWLGFVRQLKTIKA